MFLANAILAMVLLAPAADPVVLDDETKAKLKAIAFQAAREGDEKTLEEYCKAGLSPNDRNARGDTLLILAVYHGHEKAVDGLLKQKGLELDATNAMGFTALTGAAFRGNADIAGKLLKAGAKVDIVNKSGQTPLMFAALFGRVEVAKLLLKAGADPMRKDKDGKTSVDYAAGQSNAEMRELLQARIK